MPTFYKHKTIDVRTFGPRKRCANLCGYQLGHGDGAFPPRHVKHIKKANGDPGASISDLHGQTCGCGEPTTNHP